MGQVFEPTPILPTLRGLPQLNSPESAREGSAPGTPKREAPKQPPPTGAPISIKIDAIRVDESVLHARLGVIAALHIALRAKHGPAAHHSLRVAMWTSAWGIKHGLKEDQLQLFELVALMHEIGKIGIPDRVLQKTRALNEQERAMMDLHPHVGLEILRAAGASPPLLDSIASIGKKFLPDASASSETQCVVPMAARLVNIIDAFDSMTTPQVYREPMSRESAMAELFRFGGTQFDPKLVRSFAEIVLRPTPGIEERVRERWSTLLPDGNQYQHFHLSQGHGSENSAPRGSAAVNSLSEKFHRQMLNNMQQGVIFVDSEFRILEWNSAAQRMTEQNPESVLHQRWTPGVAKLFDLEGYRIPDEECPFALRILHNQDVKRRLAIKRSDDSLLLVNAETVAVHNEEGTLCGCALLLDDVSEQAELEKKIVHLHERASLDPLTKVANRGELIRTMPEFVKDHQADGQRGAVIICDIDYFKRINDSYSHQAGDEALKVFASVLRESCRATDIVARYGGEEFVLLCSDCELSEAKELAESIRKKLHRTKIKALNGNTMTASFGVTRVEPGDTDETSLARADRGLIIAKESGRDRVVVVGGDAAAAPVDAHASKPSWLEWMGLAASKPMITTELLTNVPKEITFEKLKGFVREFHGEVAHVEQNLAVIDVDCKNVPIPRDPRERMGKFRLSIQIGEMELKTGPMKDRVKLCTHLQVKVTPVRNRDRRLELVANQASRLLQAFQCFILAQEMDEEARNDIVRRIKPETDSRY